MRIRNAKESDYPKIIAVVDDWWGGRHMADMLPRLFFQHFSDTSFVAEEEGKPVGFLAGFVSQSRPNEAYVHFVGVHPDHRRGGIAVALYDRFYRTVRSRGCDTVRLVTAPINRASIAFHRSIGFQTEPGDSVVGGVAVSTDYDGKGGSRVRFVRRLPPREGSGETTHAP